MRVAEHEVSIEWHEPGSWVTYQLDGDTEGTWTGARIRLAAINAWWALGCGPPDVSRMPGLVGGAVVIHVDGTRSVYMLTGWHPEPGRHGQEAGYRGAYFDAEWPDLAGDSQPAERL